MGEGCVWERCGHCAHAPTRHTRSTVTEGLGRALARLTQPVHRPWSPSGRRGSEVPVSRPRSWPSAAARLPAAARQAGRRVLTRSFDTRSKVSIELAALAIKLAVGASPDDQLGATERFRFRVVFRTVRLYRLRPDIKRTVYGIGCLWGNNLRRVSSLRGPTFT